MPAEINQVIQFERQGVSLFLLTKDAAFDADSAVEQLSGENFELYSKFTNLARREEFLRTRWLVRHAAGVTKDPERDPDGCLVWPSNIVGSVSHSQGHVLVGIGRTPSLESIGIDMDAIARVKKNLAEKICRPADLVFVQSGQIELGDVFVAKEALFKCHFPLGRRRFWFHDAEIVRVAAMTDHGCFTMCREIVLQVKIDTGPLTSAGFLTTVFVASLPQPVGYRVAVASLGR